MKTKAIIKKARAIAERFRVDKGRSFRLKDVDPGDTLGFKNEDKHQTKEALATGIAALAELQDKLYAQDKWAVLLIFQAMDAAGKDGAIKHVMSGVNPQGCQVFSFKSPSAEELDHDYLWRCMKCLPNRGHIGIFNRSYYEETLVVRVHPEFLAAEAAARAGRQAHLEGTLRGHPQLRAVSDAQRRGRAEIFPPRLEAGTETPVPRTHRAFQHHATAGQCHRGRLEVTATRGHGDGPGHEGGTHGNTVDATFEVQEMVVNGVGLAAVVAAAPNARAGQVRNPPAAGRWGSGRPGRPRLPRQGGRCPSRQPGSRLARAGA